MVLICAVASLFVPAAQAENAAPSASFTYSPTAPRTRDTVTFTSTSTDPDGTIASYAWAIDPDGAFNDGTGSSVQHQFLSAGTYTIKLKVVDNKGASSISSRAVTIANRAPTSNFVASTASPLTGQPVTFTSTSTDADGRIAAYSWAADPDGVFDDGTSSTMTRAFATGGTYTVKLRVVDDKGAATTSSKAITVGNRAPTAAFAYTPEAPAAGDQITLTSASADPDGGIVRQEWDLDGDGAYDEAVEGPTATAAFGAGLHVVGLRVTDDWGATAETTQTIDVGASGGGVFDTSAPSGVAPPVEPLRWLDPFPTVRIRGRTTSFGVRLSLFSVRAPAGSTVRVTCSGRSCPIKTLSTRIKARKKSAVGVARIQRVERSLRAGAVLQVYITKKGLIGKYTRFKIRRIALPIRSDRCVMPDSTKPVACPAAP